MAIVLLLCSFALPPQLTITSYICYQTHRMLSVSSEASAIIIWTWENIWETMTITYTTFGAGSIGSVMFEVWSIS